MEYIDRKTQREIRTRSISGKAFDAYLRRIGVSSLDEITHEQLLDLIKIMVNEYKSGKISLDELSSAFGLIYEKTIYDGNFQELNSIIEAGSDLGYDERMATEDEPLNIEFLTKLRDILKYGD